MKQEAFIVIYQSKLDKTKHILKGLFSFYDAEKKAEQLRKNGYKAHSQFYRFVGI